MANYYSDGNFSYKVTDHINIEIRRVQRSIKAAAPAKTISNQVAFLNQWIDRRNK